jgi:hypothetical protein
LDTAQDLISKVFKDSKEEKKFTDANFAQFIQNFYFEIRVITLKTLDKPVKKMNFKEIFDEETTDYRGD